MPVTAIIVDDEPLAIDAVRRFCDADPRIDVIGTAPDGASALQLVESLRPQAMFLDIAMPGMTGLEVAGVLKSRVDAPRIVLVTAHDHFASEAFDLAVVDYVLKPVKPERLARAVDRLEAVAASAAAQRATDLWLPFRGTVVRVPIESITLVEAERDYVRVHDADRSYLQRSTLADLLERLGGGFVRVHRSIALPLRMIAGLRHAGSGVWLAVHVDGSDVPIGRSHLAAVRDRLGWTD